MAPHQIDDVLGTDGGPLACDYKSALKSFPLDFTISSLLSRGQCHPPYVTYHTYASTSSAGS